MVALIAMAVAAVAVVSAIVFAGGTRVIPWVVQVDKTNWAVAVGPAERASAVDDRVLKSMTARWIRALRTVVGHAPAQTAFVQDVYSMLTAGTAATRKTNEWFIKNNPMVNVGSHRTEVEITRIHQKGDPMHMMVDWVERTSGNEGTSQRVFEAYLSLEISPPRVEAAIIANPLGIYIVDYTLSEKTPGQQ